MERRKRLIVNAYERATHEALRAAADKYGAKVYPKVRLADALDINSSGIGDDAFAYALKAHFDFVVTDAEDAVLFAVEFDGPKHDRNIEVIHLDALKNRTCDQLGMPLLRIDDGYLRKVGSFSLVGWLTELWFMCEWFTREQSAGRFSYDEPWDYGSILGPSGRLTDRPFELGLQTRGLVARLCQKGLCADFFPTILQADDPEAISVALAIVSLGGRDNAIGVGRCRTFKFPPVSSRELSEELALVSLGDNLRDIRAGQLSPTPDTEVQSWIEKLLSWSKRHPGIGIFRSGGTSKWDALLQRSG